MNGVLRPVSLRSLASAGRQESGLGSSTTRKVSVGCLIAIASVAVAEAQEQPLPPVTVEAPVTRPTPPAAKPTKEQLRVRAALRRAARAKAEALARQKADEAKAHAAQDPYADPSAPYKVDRLASPKFSEPIADTPKSITVLSKEILQDKDATSLKEVARTTPGVTIGTGEGGNAFGDRFFIRGFDARNDVFVDGVRDPAVNSGRISSPSRSKFSRGLHRRLTAAVPLAARSTL